MRLSSCKNTFADDLDGNLTVALSLSGGLAAVRDAVSEVIFVRDERSPSPMYTAIPSHMINSRRTSVGGRKAYAAASISANKVNEGPLR